MRKIKDYEEEVLKYIEQGLTGREIAKKLGFGERCVYSFTRKLGLKSNGRVKGKAISIKKEDEEEILQLYVENNMTIKEIEKYFNGKYTEGDINYFLRIKEVTRRRGSRTFLNEDYFSETDSPKKAYFLGLMLADGCVRRTNEKHDSWTISLELVSTDSYIIEDFRKELKINTEVKTSKREGRNPTFYLKFQSSKVAKDLISLGCVPRKSKQDICLPNIREGLKRYLILGYFDGDGIASNGDSGKYIGFCGQKTLLENIEEELRKTLNLKEKRVYYNRFNNIYYLQYARKEEMEKIYNYFYSNCETLYIKRKKEKIS